MLKGYRTCKEGPGDPPETWFSLRIPTLITDVCTCWGYPSKGWRNQEESCNSSYKYLLKPCAVPLTHYPVRGTPINTKPKITILDYADATKWKTAFQPNCSQDQRRPIRRFKLLRSPHPISAALKVAQCAGAWSGPSLLYIFFLFLELGDIASMSA